MFMKKAPSCSGHWLKTATVSWEYYLSCIWKRKYREMASTQEFNSKVSMYQFNLEDRSHISGHYLKMCCKSLTIWVVWKTGSCTTAAHLWPAVGLKGWCLSLANAYHISLGSKCGFSEIHLGLSISGAVTS